MAGLVSIWFVVVIGVNSFQAPVNFQLPISQSFPTSHEQRIGSLEKQQETMRRQQEDILKAVHSLRNHSYGEGNVSIKSLQERVTNMSSRMELMKNDIDQLSSAFYEVKKQKEAERASRKKAKSLESKLSGNNKSQDLGVHSKCECPLGFIKHKESCYFISRSQASYWDAKVACRIVGGHLAMITSKSEDEFLTDYLQHFGTAGKYFVEGNDLILDGQWTLGENKTMEYTNWAEGEPNNYRGSEDCIVINQSFGYRWMDAPCHNVLNFICESLPCGSVRGK